MSTPTAQTGLPTRKPTSLAMRIVAAVSVIVGTIGIVWIIRSVGIDSLVDVMSNLSIPRFLALLVWYYMMFLFDALAWRQLISEPSRPSIWTLWKAAIAGNAINQLTPSGNLGEPLKILVLRYKGDLKEIIASLVVWNFMHMTTTMACVLVAAVPIFIFLKPDLTLILLYLGGTFVLGLPAALILGTFKYNIISRLAALVARLGFKTKRLLQWQEKIQSLEGHVFAILKERPRDILIALGDLVLSRIISISLTFGMVWVLGIKMPFVTMIYVQMLTLAVTTLFSFVPGRVGVIEGYNAIIFKTLEYTPQVGLAVSIVTRIIQVITTVFGVLILARPMLERKHQEEVQP